MRITEKHEVFSIDEKKQIALLYLDKHMRIMEIVNRIKKQHIL